MPGQNNTQHLGQIMETILAGAAMKEVSAEIMARDVSVHARHMRSIDDLLMHVEDHHVQCAVIDQSRPTESRGVKLVLLAGLRKVKHLIVIAPADSRSEIAAIDGVHKVLCSPASHEQIIGAVLAQTRRSAARTAAAPGEVPAARAVAGKTPVGAPGRPAKSCGAIAAIAAGMLHKLSLYNLTRLDIRLASRPAMATVASMFLCLGTVAVLSLASGSSMMPVAPAGNQGLAERSSTGASETKEQASVASQSPGQTVSALQAAGLSRRDAASRLQVSLRTIEMEILQQRGLRQDLQAHITRLSAIAADLRPSRDNTTARKTGMETSIASRRRLAEVKIELALQEFELSKVNDVLAKLNLVKSGITQPESHTLKLAGVRSSGSGN